MKRYQALGRMKQGTLNYTEQAYANHLASLSVAGELLWWKAHSIKVRIGDGCWFTPDFAVMHSDRSLSLVDVKGTKRKTAKNGEKYETAFTQDDARVKIASAAEQFPIKFIVAYPAKGGGWHEEEV